MRWKVILPLAATLVTACADDRYGTGIGRPPFDPATRPQPLPLRITEVYVATTGTDSAFVEIAASDSRSVELAGLELCATPSLCTSLGAGAVNDASREMVTDLSALDLSASAGTLAVVDDDDVVHAFIAWGSDPAILDSSYIADAVLSGVAEPGDFIPAVFPMPAGVAVAQEGDTAGCAPPSPGTIAVFDAGLCAPVAAILRLTEVLPIDEAGDSWVELLPLGVSEEISLRGSRICAPPSCGVLDASVDFATITRLVIHLGLPEPKAGAALGHLYLPEAAPIRGAGEVAFLAPGSTALDESKALLSFVRYGQEVATIASAAVTRGLWLDPEDSAREPRITGESLSLVRGGGVGSVAWNPTTPSPGDENPDITAANDLWLSCSWPKHPGLESDLVIQSVSREDPPEIVIHNRANDPVDLGDVVITVDTVSLALPAVDLEAAASFTVELDPGEGCSGEEDACWASPPTLDLSGEADLQIAGALVHYLQWGDGKLSTTNNEAAAAGLWPVKTDAAGTATTPCAAPALDPDTRLELTLPYPGQSPPDWS